MGRQTLKVGVGRTAEALQRNYLDRGHSAVGADARGTLASLRKAAATGWEWNPLALEDVLMALVVPLSDGELGRGDKPSPSEQAAFDALSLFGLHMQGALIPMHKDGQSFAAACGRLFAISESKSIKPRFDAMQSALDERARLVHLRNLVSLLRGKGIPFDYGSFAVDLRSLAHPDLRNGVLLRWGRDFSRGASYRSREKQDSTATD